ncbi:MAG: DUF423 domain-containing protein [Flavobacterium sp.]|jgi:uncharacterized membrane protein YgdD (TMEM256/DUF423 family)
MKKTILITGAIIGGSSIIIGAFGAHGLKDLLNPIQLNSFDTGVKYQMYHALFLLFISQCNFLNEKALKVIYWTTILGIIFFSFSIYLLATNDLTSFNFKFLGPVTPLGGLFLVASWLELLIYSIKINKKSKSRK